MSTYIAPSQIAQRQLAYFEGKNVLVAGEAEDLFPVELAKHCNSVTVFTTNYSYFRQLERYSEIERIFDVALTDETRADTILLYWPKAKAEADYLLKMLLSTLGTDTEICVVGENRSGVKSIEKMFKPFGPIQKYDSARRCSFYWGQATSEIPEFRLSDWFKTYLVKISDNNLTIKSLPGVFSHGALDIGSRLLIESLPKLSGKVLDFGCGAGVLGAVMATQNPDIELDMCDISAFAIASARATLEANGLKANVFASDIYSDTSNDYDFIVSNPPFHSGLDTSYVAAETLLEKAPIHLKRAGELYIVANSFLKYQPILDSNFSNYATLNKTNKFAIYHASK